MRYRVKFKFRGYPSMYYTEWFVTKMTALDFEAAGSSYVHILQVEDEDGNVI